MWIRPKAVSGQSGGQHPGDLPSVATEAADGIYIEFGGRFVYLNATATRLFGASSAEALIGRPVLERVPPELHPLFTEQMRLLTERPRETPTLTIQFQRLDGSVFEVEASIAAIYHNGLDGAVVSLHDITGRAEAPDPEQRTRALLNAVIEGTTDAIYVKDRECRMLLVNGAACRMVGKRADELLGRDDAAFFAPETAQAGMEHDRLLMASRTTKTYEQELTLANGQHITTQTTEGPVIDDRGEVIGLFGISRDITERKHAEEERARLREQLQHAQKMETVSRLAGGVVHDFNNLLTVISGYSDLLLAELTSSDPMYDSVSEIRKAGERAASLSRQLLVLSRKQIVLSKVLDLNAVIVEIARMLVRVIGEDIRLETDLSPSLGRIRADAGQMQQVLMNLAVNARDAMPSGGTLLVRTENVELGEDYAQQHPEVKPGALVLMEVSDNGIGMDADVKAHLFEPFFTTKRPGEGTGLGLAMVYSIVKQSGGSIWIDSEPGEGTTFKIFLPRIEEGVTPEVTPAVPDSLQGTETILVVDDQEELRKMVRVILTNFGYRVLEAGSPGEAQLVAERHAGPIHLALTDVVMPGMHGPELADRLKALRPQMEILFTSGYGEPFMTRHGFVDLDASYLPKPFSPEALATRVREVLGPPGTATILVVDDEAGIRGLLRKVLAGAGYKVMEAKNGKEALEQIRGAELDLVLTDLVMPDMEGLEMIGIIHKERPELKIIAISGMFGGRFLHAAELLGAHATLAKPIRPDDLLDAVRRVLAAGGL
ncbi:MAG TPA: response regulator [Bryobacteraceae bacterium]|jgi:PAS domain S-box-containing protein|nr:response regulator [Bryobacteraceae bacterium]